MPIEVRLPDDSLRQLPEGATGTDLAAGIGARLLEAALAIKVDGRLADLKAPLADGAKVDIVTSKTPDSLELIRHSTAHLLAQAVKRLYPKARVGIGPTIEDGFYYDFWVEKPFTPEDLPAIEAEMRKIVAEGVEVEREDLDAGCRRGAVPGHGRTPQGRGRVGDPCRRHHQRLQAGRFLRPLPRPPRAQHLEAEGLQAAQHRGRLLEGRREEPDAQPHLRHRLPHPEGAGRAPAAPGGGQGPRPPQAGQGTGALLLPPGSARLALLPPQGHPGLQRAGDLHARAVPASYGLRRSDHPPGPGRGPLEDQRPLRELRREHVLHHRRGAGIRAEAHELPGPLPHVRHARSTATATCPSATRTSAACTATSAAA